MSYGYGPQVYYAPRGPTGPVEHPSASNAVALGLLGIFCFGALSGVPAIFMGRSVLRTVAAEPHRWKGSGAANSAIVLGWISVFETAVVVTLAVAHGFLLAGLGIALGLGGVVLAVMGGMDSLRFLRNARVALAVPSIGILGASTLGILIAFSQSATANQRCEEARAQYPISLQKEDFPTARTNVSDIERNCKTAGSELVTMRLDIDSKAVASTKRKDQEEKDRVAKVAAAKEKTAVDAFPQKSIDIAAELKKATTEGDTGKWALADADLSSVEAALADFRGTSIADTKQFQQLDDKASAQRTRVDPQVQKLAKAAAAAAQEKELAAGSIAVTSTGLFNAYQANEVSADDEYKGHQLLVSGTVESIDKGMLGGLHLRLVTPNEFMSTMCSMEDSEKSQLARLSRGDRVRVLCTGQGMVIGSPSLGDCTFR